MRASTPPPTPVRVTRALAGDISHFGKPTVFSESVTEIDILVA